MGQLESNGSALTGTFQTVCKQSLLHGSTTENPRLVTPLGLKWVQTVICCDANWRGQFWCTKGGCLSSYWIFRREFALCLASSKWHNEPYLQTYPPYPPSNMGPPFIWIHINPLIPTIGDAYFSSTLAVSPCQKRIGLLRSSEPSPLWDEVIL